MSSDNESNRTGGSGPNGRPQGGSWSFFVLMAMALGLLVVSHLGRMQAQQKLQARVWKPTPAQGKAAGFDVSASEDAVAITPPAAPLAHDSETTASATSTTQPVLKRVGLGLNVLDWKAVSDGQVAVAFIANRRMGALQEIENADGSIEMKLDAAAPDAKPPRRTCVVLVGTPPGLLNRLDVTGIDHQGIPIEPDGMRIKTNATHATYEFSTRGPNEIQFLQLEPRRGDPIEEIETADATTAAEDLAEN